MQALFGFFAEILVSLHVFVSQLTRKRVFCFYVDTRQETPSLTAKKTKKTDN